MVIEVMTNVNVPFGTVNRRFRGQEGIEGRRGIICFIAVYPQSEEICYWNTLSVQRVKMYRMCGDKIIWWGVFFCGEPAHSS